MSLGDTKNSIKEIVDSTKDYQLSINSLQKRLIAVGEDINSSAKSVSRDIKADEVVDNNTNYAIKVIDSINKSLELTRTTLSKLSIDATKRIKELVDNYNNSLDPESNEERLSYIEINLTSVDGTVTFGSSRSGNGGYNGYTPPDSSNTFDIDYYFGLLGTTGVNSVDIPNWDLEIKNFLIENQLDSYITKMEFEGNIVKITLSNGKEIELENITTKEEFLDKIKEVLKEEGLME